MWGNGPLDSYPVLFPLKHLPMATVGWQATGLDGSLVLPDMAILMFLIFPSTEAQQVCQLVLDPCTASFTAHAFYSSRILCLISPELALKFQLISGELEGNSRGSTDHVP